MEEDNEVKNETNEANEASGVSEIKEVEEAKETSEFEEVPVYQEVEKKQKEVRTDSYFDGGVLELIGWRLLAGLITVITLGIGIPWAQCMLYSWKLKHTVYNGKRLKFEGTGGDLFVQMFKWLFFSIITLGIYLFFVPVKKAKWVLSNIHYEDEELVKDESFFDGKTLGYIGISILTKLITVFSLGLLYPFAVCIKLRWINNHSIINRKKLVFDGAGVQLWGKYILWSFLTIITLGIFGLWLPILIWKWETKHVHIRKVGEEVKKDKSLFIIIPVLVLLIIGAIALLSTLNIDFSAKNPQEWISNIFGDKGFVVSAIREDSSASGRYESAKAKYLKGKMSAKEFAALVEEQMYFDESFLDEDEEFKQKLKDDLGGEYKDFIKRISPSEPEKVVTPAKTSITVGGYTLKFGTYKGQIVQGVWDEETMTSTARYTDIILKLTESTITVNGDSGSYYVSGSSIVWKGSSYYFDVTGNNKIRYNAESCPELIYQGY